MHTALILTLLSLTFLTHSQQKLNYLPITQTNTGANELIDQFAAIQPEIYRKVFTHYIDEQIKEWRKEGWSQHQILTAINGFVTDPNGPLLANLDKYMRARLYQKLEMGLLTQSLQNQIKANPDNFYLTYDIYDLLFD